LLALLYITLGIVKHIGLVVPFVNDFVAEEASSRVVSPVAIMNFLHHFLEECVLGGQVLELCSSALSSRSVLSFR